MQQLATIIRGQIDTLVDQYDARLHTMPGYSGLPEAMRRDLERHFLNLIAESLEAGDYSPLVQYAQQRASQWEARGLNLVWFQQALIVPEDLLVPLVQSVETSNFVWQALNRSQSAVWQMVAERTLQTEERFRSIVETAHSGIMIVDDQFHFLYANEQLTRISGYSQAELIGADFRQLLDEDSRRLVADRYMRRQRGEDVSADYEIAFVRKDGQKRYVEMSAVLLRDASGRQQTVAQVLDVSERKQSEQALRDSQQLLQSVMDNIPQAVFWKDRQLRYLGCNQAFAEDTGLNLPQSIVGKTDYDMPWQTQAELYRADDQHVMDSGAAKVNYEEPQTTPSGETTWLRTSKIPMRDADSNVIAVLGMYEDITARKNLEQQVQESLVRRGHQVQVSTQVAQDIAAASDLPELFHRVVTLIKERFNYYHAQIFRYDPGRDAVVLVTGYGEIGQRLLADKHQLPMGRGVVGTAAASGQSILATDVTQAEDWRPNPHLPDTKGELAVPIKLRDEVLGILDVQSDRAGTLSDDDRLLLEGLCGQIAIAIKSKEAEAALAREQYLMHALMDNVPDYIYFKDRESRFIRISKAHARSFGLNDPAQAVGKTDFDFFTEEHARPAYEDEQEIIRTGQPISKEEKETRPDQPDRWVLTTKLPLRDEAGNIVGTFGMSRDITDRKQSELRLQELLEKVQQSEQLMRTLIDAMPDEIYAKDTQGRLILANTAEAHQRGVASPEMLISQSDFDFYPRELAEQYFAAEQPIYQEGQSLLNFEEQSLNAEGRLTWHASTKVPLRNNQGQIIGLVGATRDITELKHIEQEREQLLQQQLHRNLQLQATAEVGRVATSILNPDQLLGEIVTLVATRFGFYHVAAFTVDESGRWAQLRAATGEVGQQLLDRGQALGIRGKSLVGNAIRQRQPRIALDVGPEAVQFDDPLLSATHSEIALPLFVGDRVLGALDVQSTMPAAFDENSAIVLQSMADQIAVALNNAEQYQREQAHLEQTNRLMQIVIDLSERTDRAGLQNRLVRSALSLLDSDRAQFWLKGASGLELKAAQSVRPGADQSLVISQELADRVYRTGLPLRLDSPPVQAGYASRITDVPFNAALMAPISWQGHTTGVLSVMRSQPGRPFTQDDENSTQLLAAQAAAALENITLAEQQQHRAVQLQTAAEVSQVTSSILSLDTLLPQAAEVVRARFNLYYVGIFLTDETERWAVLRAGTGDAGQQMLANGHKLKIGEASMISQCIVKQQAQIALDVGEEAIRFDNPRLPLTRSELALPLISRGRVIGAVTIQSDQPAAFTSDDITGLQTMADQIGNAVENARLYEQIQVALGDTDRLLHASAELNVSQTYNDVLDVIRKYTLLGQDAQTIAINVFDRPWTDSQTPVWIELIGYHTTQASPMDLGTRFPIATFPSAKALLRPDEPTIISDVQNDPRLDAASRELYGKRLGAGSTIFLPLATAGKWIGYVNVIFSQPRAFEEESVRLLTTALEQASTVIESLRRLNDLTTSGAQLAEALQISKLAYWEYDVEKDQFLFNDQLYSIFHTTAEQAGGYQLSSAQYAQKFVYPDDLSVVGAEIEKALNSTDRHYTRDLVHRILYADGGVGYISVSINIDRDEQGQILRYYGANQDITELKHIEQEREQLLQQQLHRNLQLQATAEVGRVATSILNPDQLLGEIVTLVATRFGFYHVAAFTVDESGRWAQLRAATGEVGQQLLDRGQALGIRGKSLVGSAIRQRQPQMALDVGPEAVHFDDPLLPTTRSEIALPLFVGDRVLGALDVHSTLPAAFDENSAILLQSMANQIAVALDNAEKYQREQAHVEQTNRLIQIVIDLSERTDRAGLQDRLVRSALSLLDTDRAQFWLKGASGLELKAAQSVRPGADQSLAISQELADRAYRTGLPLRLDSPPVQTGYASRITDVPFNAALMAPISWQGHTTGVLSVMRSQPGRPFTQDDENSAQLLAAQAAAALENITLAEQQQHRAVQLQTAAEVSQVTSSILSLDTLLPQAAEVVRARFNLYYVGIFLTDETERWAVLRAGTGDAGQQMLANGHKLKIGEASMISQCIVKQQARIALDVGEEAIRFDNPRLPLTRSELALPLISRGRVIGAVTIQSDQPAAFTSDDITGLQTMADQIGNAVENARLYEQSNAALQEVDALNRRLTGEAWESYLHHQGGQQVISVTDNSQTAPDLLPQLDGLLAAGEIVVEPAEDDQSEATVTAPILLRGQPIGALRMRTPLDTWDKDTEAVLTGIAGHIAQAVENARLIEQTQRTASRERAINEINARVRQTIDLDAILRTAVNELGQSLKAARVTAHINVADSDQSSRRFADPGDQPQPGAAGSLRGNDHD